MKYVSDKFNGVAYCDIVVPDDGGFDDMLALIGDKNSGEKLDRIIGKNFYLSLSCVTFSNVG